METLERHDIIMLWRPLQLSPLKHSFSFSCLCSCSCSLSLKLKLQPRPHSHSHSHAHSHAHGAPWLQHVISSEDRAHLRNSRATPIQTSEQPTPLKITTKHRRPQPSKYRGFHLTKKSASPRPPSKSHVVSWRSA